MNLEYLLKIDKILTKRVFHYDEYGFFGLTMVVI